MTETAISRKRRQALAAFYATHHRHVQAAVHYRARQADDAIIADACAIAWLKLVRRPDITLDGNGAAWLKTTAAREAWRLMDRGAEILAGVFLTNPDDADELAEPATLDGDPVAAAINHETQRERVEQFATLKARERRDLVLNAGGYTYHEIATLTGSSYTAVNRRISEGRARLRPVHRPHGHPARTTGPKPPCYRTSLTVHQPVKLLGA
jgi:DNA-directed RNA polymerase specialized sigma24 family protein